MDELVGQANLGGLLLLAVTEKALYPVDIPKHKVEKGIDLSDHVERMPTELSISGLLVRPTNERVETAIAKLRKISESGKATSYKGRRIYTNMLLHGIELEADVDISNGHRFSCTLTEVRVANSALTVPKVTAQTKPVSTAGRKDAVNKKTENVYHTVKKGDTYGSLAKKYGTTAKQLEAWNKHKPKSIPIGAKLRVK